MTVLGHWLTILATLASALAAISYCLTASGRHTGVFKPFPLTVLSTFLVVLASADLLSLFLLHDFSNGYVFSYSDRALPLSYLISCFYAGQEGSFLFWVLCSSIIALLLHLSAKARGNEPWIMSIFMSVQTLLLLLVVAKSPFRLLWDLIPGVKEGTLPADGRGLNPLLQNMWMVIHPPILFLGFAAMAAPFSIAIAGLWKGDRDILPRQAFPWVLSAIAILGLGIMLGAYWAYGVLGWGGYWGWDPVENSSLVPWILSVALLHTMLAQSRTGKFVRTNMIMAFLSFLLVMYSTFLTRSGILSDVSVHSFEASGSTVYWLLLAALLIITVASVALLALRWRAMKPTTSEMLFFTREASLGAGSLVLVLCALVVLFGTSLPIVSHVRVEPSFYDTTNLPIAAAIVLLIGLSLYTQWEFEDRSAMMKRSAQAFSASVIMGIGLYVAGLRDIPHLVLSIACVFAIVVNIDIMIRVARGNWLFLGGKLAHIGVALFLLGVVASGRYATSERFSLMAHRPTQALGGVFTLQDARLQDDGKTVFDVAVERGSTQTILRPVMFEAPQQGMMKNPGIASFLTRDLYLSPLSYEESPQPGVDVVLQKGIPESFDGAQLLFGGFDMQSGHDAMNTDSDGGIAVGALVEIKRGPEREVVVPKEVMRSNAPPESPAVRSAVLHGTVRMIGINVGNGATPSTIRLNIAAAGTSGASGILVVEASIKPFIGLVWVGTLVMLAGFLLAVVKRAKEKNL